MKKIVLIGLMCAVANITALSSYCYEDFEQKSLSDNIQSSGDISVSLQDSIADYKTGDYLACISKLKEYTSKNDDNAIAWYYLGNAYMNIAMTNEANAAFDRVIELAAIPKLTSYSIQAKLCMKDSKYCKYENFSSAEITKLKENPEKFISDYYDSLNKKVIKSDETIQIENLINGYFANNIHSDANSTITQIHTIIETSQINSGKN